MPGSSSSRDKNGWSNTVALQLTVATPSIALDPMTLVRTFLPTLNRFSSLSVCSSAASEMWQ